MLWNRDGISYFPIWSTFVLSPSQSANVRLKWVKADFGWIIYFSFPQKQGDISMMSDG
jgi:hypothetical protein